MKNFILIGTIMILFLISFRFVDREAMPEANLPFIEISNNNSNVENFKEKVEKAGKELSSSDYLVVNSPKNKMGVLSFSYEDNINKKLKTLRGIFLESKGYKVNIMSNRDMVFSTYIYTADPKNLNLLLNDLSEKFASIKNLRVLPPIPTRVNKKKGALLRFKVNGRENIKVIDQLNLFLNKSNLFDKYQGEKRVSFDLSQYYHVGVDTLKTNIIVTIFILIGLIYLFFKDKKITLIIFLLFPLTFMISFIFFKPLGITLNVVSLAGFALSLGILVDNYVVSAEETIKNESTVNIKKTLLIANLTTLIVLLPIFLKNSFISQLFGDIAKSLGLAILISYLLGIYILPIFLKKPSLVNKNGILENLYKKFLYSLNRKRNRLFVIFLFLITLFISILNISKLSINLFPTITSGRFVVALDKENNIVEDYLLSLDEIEYVENKNSNYYAKINDDGNEAKTLKVISNVQDHLKKIKVKNFEVNEGNNSGGDFRKINIEFTERVSKEKREKLVSGILKLENIEAVKFSDTNKFFNGNRIYSYSFSLKDIKKRNQIKRNVINFLHSNNLSFGKEYSSEFNMNPTNGLMNVIIITLSISFTLLLGLLWWFIKSIKIVGIVFSMLLYTILFSCLGLNIMEFELDIFAIVGFIVLIGISINNFILIIDGSKKDRSILSGCRTKFKTILFTTLTTFLGGVPLILSNSPGSIFYSNMALTIAFGSIGAFISSLVFFPAIKTTIRR